MVKACLWKYAFIFPSITIDIDSDDRIGDSSIFSSDLTSSTSDSLYRRESYLTIKSKNDRTINYLYISTSFILGFTSLIGFSCCFLFFCYERMILGKRWNPSYVSLLVDSDSVSKFDLQLCKKFDAWKK